MLPFDSSTQLEALSEIITSLKYVAVALGVQNRGLLEAILAVSFKVH